MVTRREFLTTATLSTIALAGCTSEKSGNNSTQSNHVPEHAPTETPESSTPQYDLSKDCSGDGCTFTVTLTSLGTANHVIVSDKTTETKQLTTDSPKGVIESDIIMVFAVRNGIKTLIGYHEAAETQ